jgi:Polyketide cyclase / dehydrase and lipid transport
MAIKNQRWWLTEDRVDIVISADAGTLYDMVSDLSRVGEWSPECEGVDWVDSTSTPVAGTRFVGHNAVGPGRRIRYSRCGRVLTADRAREFAFATEEGGREGTTWCYSFEPHPAGTRVVESYRVEWIPWWARVIDVPLNRHKELVHNMRTTLANLKTAAERRADSDIQPELRPVGTGPEGSRS